jgi:hypothetical protein
MMENKRPTWFASLRATLIGAVVEHAAEVVECGQHLMAKKKLPILSGHTLGESAILLGARRF